MSENPFKYLSPEQVSFYEKNGYLILENFASADEISSMKQQANTWLEEFEKRSDIPVFLFTTHSDQASQRNAYFQNSVRGVWPFFEEKALNPSNGTLMYPYKQSINKIGHGALIEVSTALLFLHSSPVAVCLPSPRLSLFVHCSLLDGKYFFANWMYCAMMLKSCIRPKLCSVP